MWWGARGLLHLRAREHARSLSPSPLPPSPSLCVRGCDITWYTKPAVLFCAFLCTIISSLLALRINCWDLSMLMRVALVCSFHSHESNVTLGHTRASADRPRLLIGWNCKWSSYKKPGAQQQNISGVSTKEGNFLVLEYIGCPMVLFSNLSDLLSHQQEPSFSHILTNTWYRCVSDVTFVGCKQGPFRLPIFSSQLLVQWACFHFLIGNSPILLYISCSYLTLTFLLVVCLWYYWTEYLYVIWRVTCFF